MEKWRTSWRSVRWGVSFAIESVELKQISDSGEQEVGSRRFEEQSEKVPKRINGTESGKLSSLFFHVKLEISCLQLGNAGFCWLRWMLVSFPPMNRWTEKIWEFFTGCFSIPYFRFQLFLNLFSVQLRSTLHFKLYFRWMNFQQTIINCKDEFPTSLTSYMK